MLRRLTGGFFVAAGVMHFVTPKTYMKIMPEYLPAHRELVYASGVAEIAGGAGLLHPATRRPARWWLIATLIAVFPANLNMALHPERYAEQTPGGRATLVARLPLQLVLIAWVRAISRSRPTARSRAGRRRRPRRRRGPRARRRGVRRGASAA
jgi:uncharacterized membrane protein